MSSVNVPGAAFVLGLFRKLQVLLFPLAYALFNSPLGFYALQVFSKAPPHSLVSASSSSSSNGESLTTDSDFEVLPIPCSKDNYGYLLIDKETGEAVAIDPLDAERFLATLNDRYLKLIAILCTHKHWDHTGGNSKIHSVFPDVPVYGHPLDFPSPTPRTLMVHLTRVTHLVQDSQVLQIGRMRIQVLHTPCHTRGSVMFLLLDGSRPKSLFTGDTLFTGGVGIFFEGDAREMHAVLERLAKELELETRVYPGHEYAVPNLTFGLEMEPDNNDIKTRLEHVTRLRSEKLPTIPGTLGDELKTNVYLRLSHCSMENEIQTLIETILCKSKTLDEDPSLLEMGDSTARRIRLLGSLRQLKDQWKVKT